MVNYSYDGNGELIKSKETINASCPLLPGQTMVGAASASRIGRSRRHIARHHLTSYYIQYETAWNTALGGVPTLAYQHESKSCTDIGHGDYIMGPNGEPIEQVYYDADTNTWTPDWYYLDFQGNTRVLLGKSGGTTADASYNEPPWGTATQWIGNSIGITTPLQYVGELTDQWTGYTYNQARWYDTTTGQFVSQDPLSAQTLQTYGFASDNPANGSDPTGLYPWVHCHGVGDRTDRYRVKEGWDSWATQHPAPGVGKNPFTWPITGTTIAQFQSLGSLEISEHIPQNINKNTPRQSILETTLFKIWGQISCGSHDCIDWHLGEIEGKDSKGNNITTDGDLTFNIVDDKSGHYVHCEIPNYDCTQGAPPWWRQHMQKARESMVSLLKGAGCHPEENEGCHPGVSTFVYGFGFWDTIHWKSGQGLLSDLNHEELHPVVGVDNPFGTGSSGGGNKSNTAGY